MFLLPVILLSVGINFPRFFEVIPFLPEILSTNSSSLRERWLVLKVSMTRRSHVITVDGDGNVTEEIQLFSYNLNVTQLRMDPNFIRWTKCVYKNFLQFQSDNANNILFGWFWLYSRPGTIG